MTPKEGDFLYRAADLATLAGDRYKSQRALCNRVERMGNVAVAPFEMRDRRECRTLLASWQRQKRAGDLDAFGRYLLDDATAVHEVMWAHASELDLTGRVLRIEGRIRGYTFGYWLTERTYCVLLEVTDRSIPGSAQYLFRESCRRALERGAEFINTMDDAGLPGLRASKRAYHPLREISSFVLTEGNR